jgi:sulfhydrogenase subunit beta (sulfur reductase)
MPPYYAASSDFERLLAAWSSDKPVYVPTTRAGHRHWTRYSPESPVVPELDGIRAVEPLKSFYFRLKERVAAYPGGPDPLQEEPGFVLVGAKNCDLRGLECLDHTFTEGPVKDPFWVTRREKALVVGSDCSEPAETCFCTLLGAQPYPESSFDLSIATIESGILLEIGSEKGEMALRVDGFQLKPATYEQIAERDLKRERTRRNVEEQNRKYETANSYVDLVSKNFESPAWTKYVGRCREDAACLAVCPTCHCFLLYDQKSGDTNERVRVWDFCYLRGYTRCGGGHTARATGNDRFKNKYVKKFQFYPSQYDMMACTGCGRCVEACLAGIDMRQVLHDLEESQSG